MKLPGKLHHRDNINGYLRSESSTYEIIETVNAIIDYLASKEESIVGENIPKKYSIKCKHGDWLTVTLDKELGLYVEAPQAQEKECCEKCIKHPKSDLVCKGFCQCHKKQHTKLCRDLTEAGMKHTPIPCTCPCHKEPVSERNALIDELVEDMKRMMAFGKANTPEKIWVGNGSDCLYVNKEDVIDLLKSKKK